MIFNRNLFSGLGIIFVMIFIISCKEKPRVLTTNEEMALLLKYKDSVFDNNINNELNIRSKIAFFDSLSNETLDSNKKIDYTLQSANAHMQAGDEQGSIAMSIDLMKKINYNDDVRRTLILKNLGLSYLRSGEQDNCLLNHGRESCVFPITGNGVHKDKMGSSKAIQVFEILVKHNPLDLESKWLLNIAYMTLGMYPQQVPTAYIIKGLDAPSKIKVNPFVDIAANLGIDFKDQSGGCIVDDFNGDGYFDIITSSWDLKEGMRYYQNNTDGTFSDLSKSSGINLSSGALNITVTDYNNDGLKDVFVLRGAWKRNMENDPNSLLKNNGDGTFTDVTKAAGLLTFHPKQTATWCDFNNDGWLDVFIGNETQPNSVNETELFLNNKNGTFTDVAKAAGCNIQAFIKGVGSGDLNNDGLSDIFISTLDGNKYILQNTGITNGLCRFKDISIASGVRKNSRKTFSAWIFDYNNDGWLDIGMSGYEFNGSLAPYAAASYTYATNKKSGEPIIYRNNQNGTFTDVSDELGFNKVAFAMGSNFGDIDNDGFQDIYLGTGNPRFESLIPNKLYKNMGGKKFEDITNSARVGSLQKGHGISFVDIDNDGDVDIFAEMGGALPADSYQNSLYQNPGQNNNAYIDINFTGVKSNRMAVGAKLKVTFIDNDTRRSVYKDVNSGGSFGCSPLRQHIGVGKAKVIESIEVMWPVTKQTQKFTNVAVNQIININENSNTYTKTVLKKLVFNILSDKRVMCAER